MKCGLMNCILPLIWCSAAVLAGVGAQAPAAGTIIFLARIHPTGARDEPVRDMSFYLLRKSLTDIRKEAQRTEPPANMDKFIDGLSVSPELKAWMKKHHRVDLSGPDFTKQLTGEDITTIPEFLDAYTTQNSVALGGRMPTPKYKESEKDKNRAKYQREREEYRKALRQFVNANPETLQGLDAALSDKNPSERWAQLRLERQRNIDRRVLELAQTRYLAAMTDSDLNGRGVLTGLAPGTYWITTLNAPALAGDVRLRWDVPVTVHAGGTTRIELSNLNAIEPPDRSAP
jgi:hypothetical protein